MDPNDSSDFERHVAEHRSPSLVREFFGFLRQNKKWWLLPILIALLLFGALLLLSTTVFAPFIYPLF
jgi:hypothetical protein